MTDLSARLIYKFLKIRDSVGMGACSFVFRIWASAWNIRLAPGCNFYGWPILRKHAGSGIEIGRNCTFRSSRYSNLLGLNRPCGLSTLRPGASIIIGADCGFSGTVIGAAAKIQIGDRVLCGANTTITDTDWHNLAPELREDYCQAPSAPVVIEDDVWLGLNVTVLKGVRIGRGSVIAAGSVVVRDVPEGCLAGGTPARVLRRL
jgi:acetyltransferase-like isoleucine patch superfamily enzyme